MIDATRIAAYYDAQAARYDATMDSEPRNARFRDAFRTLVAERIPRGGRILDFGCGTGLDAAWYASRGFTVIAYDPSARMIDQLTIRCQREIADGVVTPLTVPFDGPVDAIVANFAVLNLVPDLSDLFGRFARAVAPGGQVIVSVINPFYWRDLRCGWWWRALSKSWGSAMLTVEGSDAASYRHYLGAIARAASPAFRPALRRGALLGQFTFLGFERAP
jgi:SAM-dependent methyltransferase